MSDNEHLSDLLELMRNTIKLMLTQFKIMNYGN